MSDSHPEPAPDSSQGPVPPAEDFTGDRSEPSQYEAIQVQPYDPRPVEDAARRHIAYILLGLLGFAFLVPPLVLFFQPCQFDNLMKLYQLIFTPLVALVSAATGFYFAQKGSPSGLKTKGRKKG
jgi:hypothetical protein